MVRGGRELITLRPLEVPAVSQAYPIIESHDSTPTSRGQGEVPSQSTGVLRLIGGASPRFQAYLHQDDVETRPDRCRSRRFPYERRQTHEPGVVADRGQAFPAVSAG